MSIKVRKEPLSHYHPCWFPLKRKSVMPAGRKLQHISTPSALILLIRETYFITEYYVADYVQKQSHFSIHVQAVKIVRRRFTRNISQVKKCRYRLSVTAKKFYFKFHIKIYVKVGSVCSFQSNLEPGITDA